eukprot:scaffold86698_cov60-Phaeocystis_antarctica.AAC.2
MPGMREAQHLAMISGKESSVSGTPASEAAALWLCSFSVAEPVGSSSCRVNAGRQPPAVSRMRLASLSARLCSRSTRGMASVSVAVVSAASTAGTSSADLSISAVSPSWRLAAVRMRTLSAARALSEPGASRRLSRATSPAATRCSAAGRLAQEASSCSRSEAGSAAASAESSKRAAAAGSVSTTARVATHSAAEAAEAAEAAAEAASAAAEAGAFGCSPRTSSMTFMSSSLCSLRLPAASPARRSVSSRTTLAVRLPSSP